jgi:hypothetical protein
MKFENLKKIYLELKDVTIRVSQSGVAEIVYPVNSFLGH